MVKVLVTGGAGYIGSHVCKVLAENGYEPIAYDNLLAAKATRVKWGPFEQGDLRDMERLEAVFDSHKPEAVIHMAAMISVGGSVREPAETYDVNVSGSLNLLMETKRRGIKRVVFSSTAAVYGVPESSPIVESAPKLPINPYGRSKLMVEGMLEDFSRAYGMNYAVLRFFNAAGALVEEGLGYEREDATHLVPLALLAIRKKRPPLQVMGADYPTADGTAIRDYLHVVDLAEAHVRALRVLEEKAENLTLNLGTSVGLSVRQVLAAIREVTGEEVPHVVAGRREGDPAILVADARLANKMLGWLPRRSSIQQIIADDWAWHRTL